MTRITKLEAYGFKSFAKKTVLLFPANFSVIAGPNGSGKSNVLDAICFVLGRTSAKSLRADKMKGVVFNGSKTKKASEFARVALYFDNSEKDFPVEDNQVVISRKVNAKGISIYKLNGKTVTRETIQEVLRAAHIQPDGHNIILQGKVTQIIEMSPRQRREIIDDISGISEFNQKREKASRELQIVENRLETSSNVLDERKKNLEKLKSEKDGAEKYKKLTNEIQNISGSLAKKKLNTVKEALDNLEKNIKEKENIWKETETQFTEVDKQLSQFENEKQKVDKKIFKLSSGITTIQEIEKIKSGISSKKIKIESKEFEIEQIDQMIKRLEQLKHEDTSSRAVQAIIKLGKPGVFGTISQLSKVKSKYQTAIEITAGGHIDDIIVDTKETAVECLNYLKSNRIGRATFLPLDKIKERTIRDKRLIKEKGIINVAIDLIDFDKKYWHAFSFVFGGTIISENIDIAKRHLGKERIVTLDGDLLEKSGAIIGGFFRKSKGKFTDSSEIEKYKKKKENAKQEIISLSNELNLLNEKLNKISKQEVKEDAQDIQKEVKEVSQKMEQTRNKRRELYDKKETLQGEVNRLKVNRARLEAEFDNIKEDVGEYKIGKEYDLDINKLEIKLNEARVEINAIGTVNMKALEDYTIIRESYQSLKQKVDQLALERTKVFEMMMKVESQRREVFMNTFNSMKKYFKTVFYDLMGGEGNLILENEDLEGGLVIEASPKGKKLKNIDSMSGGEKTIAALAFIFAIQMFSPAPFYVLDEVDAALDKPNTKKIVQLIKKYSENGQFIVISHNDVTVQNADSVYGVSMEEGESKVIGIRMPS